jgi:3-phenylpropionate/trans-cinnamate dioxygenase ferredoxin subunit
VIALDGLRRANRPVYQDVASADDLAAGTSRALDIGGVPILLVRAEGVYFCLSNRCDESPLPLEFSAVRGHEIVCSWHGCRYDVRTGHRLDGVAGRLHVYPVKVEDGRVMIAVTTEPVSR